VGCSSSEVVDDLIGLMSMNRETDTWNTKVDGFSTRWPNAVDCLEHLDLTRPTAAALQGVTTPPGTALSWSPNTNRDFAALVRPSVTPVKVLPSIEPCCGRSMSWSQNADRDFAAYKLIRSSITPVSLLAGTGPCAEGQGGPCIVTVITNAATISHTDHPPTDGTFYYRLFTFDRAGLSKASNEVESQNEGGWEPTLKTRTPTTLGKPVSPTP
jgi:hypothetical protein